MNYEPDAKKDSLLVHATAAKKKPWVLLLDWLLDQEGCGHVMYPFENYYDGDLNAIR